MLTFKSMEKIAIASGKGGVGKTSLTLIIANFLKSKGYKVGLLDADIHGPNLVQLLVSNNDVSSPKSDKGTNQLVPQIINNFVVNSIDFSMSKEEATIWRGPLVSKVIKHLYLNTKWGELDYLLIDMPPGTGDAYLTILDSLEIDKILLVAVEDDFCISNLHKTCSLINKLNKQSLGIIENLSENFSVPSSPVISKRIKNEFDDEILFVLPRLPRKIFYQEVNNLDKLRRYIPENFLI
jgi:ATP-binding protein involved in chromosome partitioning